MKYAFSFFTARRLVTEATILEMLLKAQTTLSKERAFTPNKVLNKP